MSPDWWRWYSLLSPVSPRKWEFSTYHQETAFSIFQLLKQRAVLSGFNLPFGWRYFWALGYKYSNFLKQFSTWVALLRKIKIDGRGQLPSRRSMLCVQEKRPSPDKEMSRLDPKSCCPAFVCFIELGLWTLNGADVLILHLGENAILSARENWLLTPPLIALCYLFSIYSWNIVTSKGDRTEPERSPNWLTYPGYWKCQLNAG